MEDIQKYRSKFREFVECLLLCDLKDRFSFFSKYESLDDLFNEMTEHTMKEFQKIFFNEERKLLESGKDVVVGANIDLFLTCNPIEEEDSLKKAWYYELVDDLVHTSYIPDLFTSSIIEPSAKHIYPIIIQITIKPLLDKYFFEDICGIILSFL